MGGIFMGAAMLRNIEFQRYDEGTLVTLRAWVEDSKKLKPGVRVTFKEENNEHWWEIVSLGSLAEKESVRGLQRFKLPTPY